MFLKFTFEINSDILIGKEFGEAEANDKQKPYLINRLI